MKMTKRIMAVLLAVFMLAALAVVPASAAEDATIKVSGEAVKGQTYSAYKIFDLKVEGGATYYTIQGDSVWYTFFTTNPGYVTFTKDASDTAEPYTYYVVKADGFDEAKAKTLAAAAMAYVTEKSITTTYTVTAAATATEVSISVPLGYYLVDSSLGSLCGLTIADTTADITDKNGLPLLEKSVDKKTASIGDTLTYTATITAAEGATNYVLHDSMEDGLTFKSVSSVKLNSVVVDASNYIVKTGSDVADGCDFEIEFKQTFLDGLKDNDKIVVEYTATLNADATFGNDGNTNTAVLKHTGDDKNASATTYTFKAIVNKVKVDDTALEGAGFTLYKDGVQVGSEIKDVTTFVFSGLGEGTYKLVESTVPAGYTKAADVEFEISATYEADDVTLKELVSGGEIAADNSSVTFKVVNKMGSTLPETGGIGTTVFYVVGLALVLGAVVLLLNKKRANG